ncbi:MAG: DNA-directed RNA polymerase subunit omega [Lachnospiraceae bacterium]|nr:DNA-directed RNA polymerase subunit omega [Lachnospiraceae bacterium]
MIHPSYSELMKVVNSEVEPGDEPVINSRYSIVMATAKRARQLVAGQDALVPEKENGKTRKPLSIAVDELNKGMIKIMGEDAEGDADEGVAVAEGAAASDDAKENAQDADKAEGEEA